MDYGKYIENVCKYPDKYFKKPNEIEKKVGEIIAGGEKDSFCLLKFFSNDNKFHLYEVEDYKDEKRHEVRWWVKKMDLNISYPMQKEEIEKYKCSFWYDSKNGKVKCDSLFLKESDTLNKFVENLTQWVNTLKVSCEKIYIEKEPCSETLPLLYALQEIGKNIVEIKATVGGSESPLKINFPPLMTCGVDLYNESSHIALIQYIKQDTLIPLADETLDSPFLKKANNECNLTWRDLLPTPTSREDDITIGDYKCKLISVDQYKVDLFRNVFIKTLDHISKETKIVHVYDPFRNNRNIETVAYVGEVMDSPAEGETASNILSNINDIFKRDCDEAIEHYSNNRYKDCLNSVRNLIESLSAFLVYNMSSDVYEAQALFSGEKKYKMVA